MPDQWLSASQAAARLGVKPETLYAYVSRGLLTSQPVGKGRRGSRYDRAEIERLAARARRGGRAGALEVLVDTGLTLLEPEGRLYYRGWNVTDAARVASYERVAEWLWTGVDDGEPPAWKCSEHALEVVTACTTHLPDSATLVDRMRVAIAAVATTDPLRHDRRPEAVVIAGRALVAALVDCLPRLGSGAKSSIPTLDVAGHDRRRNSIAARLWSRLSARRPSAGELAVINTALALLADHELAASTLAARVAASTWADPYLVVQTGLGALGGPLHGAHSESARALLVEVSEGTPAAQVVGQRLRSATMVPGLGHAVYRVVDPRATALLVALEQARPPARLWAGVQDVIRVVSERNLPPPNVDLALGAVCMCLDLAPGSGEVIFAVARCAGWLAHAIEEYQYRLRFRPRAVYVGPAPHEGDGPPDT